MNEKLTSSVIDNDLYCVRCEYNLRKQNEAGCCPECGTLVAVSLRQMTVNLREMQHAAKLLAICGILLFCVYLSDLPSRWQTIHLWYYRSKWSWRVDDLLAFMRGFTYAAVGILVVVVAYRLARIKFASNKFDANIVFFLAICHLMCALVVACSDFPKAMDINLMRQTIDLLYKWNQWGLTGLYACEVCLTVGVSRVILKFATRWNRKGLRLGLVFYAIPTLILQVIYIASQLLAGLQHYSLSSYLPGNFGRRLYEFYETCAVVISFALPMFWVYAYITIRSLGKNLNINAADKWGAKGDEMQN